MIEEKVTKLLTPSIEDLGCVLWGCEYVVENRRSILRLYIDKPTGVGIEDCQRVSQCVSALLDVEDIVPGHYSLEVSSPGVPRPLFHREQYQQHEGQMVQIRVYQPLNNRRKFVGQIISADENELMLKIEEETKCFSFTNIAKAYLV